jgi:hypothetical protein
VFATRNKWFDMHPFIGGQNHGTICDKFGFLCLEYVSFDLWMFRVGHDTFTLVMNFINSQWVPCHVTTRLFETTNMVEVATAM